MSARKQRRASEQEVTARPRPLSQELPKRVVPEEGLSVDPEDLGTEWLQDATEQDNVESAEGNRGELSIVEGPPGDEALVGPNFEPDKDIWERTVDLTLQNDGSEAARAEADEHRREADPDDQPRGVDQHIDLSEESVHEASLLDEEADELGETRAPDLKTDDGARSSRK